MFTSSMKFLLGVAVCAALALPLVCNASDAKGKSWRFAANTPEAFADQAEKVRDDMGPEGRYREVSTEERAVVEAELVKIEGLIRYRGAADKLDDADMVELMNAQEHINAVLTKNYDDQLICTLVQRTGTWFKVKTCATEFERAERMRKEQHTYHNNVL